MKKLSKNIAAVIITSAALMTAAISCLYAQKVKSKAECRRVREQKQFPHLKKSDLERLTGNGCCCIAAHIDNNSYSDNDYGNYARECAAFILRSLADNMIDGETLAGYFMRNERVFEKC